METQTAPGTTTRPAPVHITEQALREIRNIMETKEIPEGYGLRVGVVGGGCSGFQYALDFENEARDTDAVYDVEGLTVYVDPVSARYLQGTTIDYVMGMAGAGFKFENPNATRSCGCGTSFSA